jgi:mRNA interferase HicA
MSFWNEHNTFVDLGLRNRYVGRMNPAQAKRFLARRGATFAPGKGGHLIVTLNGKRSERTRERPLALWLAILKQLDVKE